MEQENGSYLATMLCMYALFEFLLRRAFLVSRGVMVQGIVLLSLLLLGTSGFLSWKLAGLYGALALLYVLCESTSSTLTRRAPTQMLELFIAKQILMVGLFVLLWRFALPIIPNAWYTTVERSLLQTVFPTLTLGREKWPMALLIMAAYFFVVDGGTKFVRGVLDKFPGLYTAVTTKLNKQGGSEHEENVGEWIGVLERIIALTFILTGSFTALAFVLTAKSIARFKELEDKQFSEYYILGTSASLIVALFAGMAIRLLFGL
jgi:riboflavin transporter FmnP